MVFYVGFEPGTYTVNSDSLELSRHNLKINYYTYLSFKFHKNRKINRKIGGLSWDLNQERSDSESLDLYRPLFEINLSRLL